MKVSINDVRLSRGTMLTSVPSAPSVVSRRLRIEPPSLQRTFLKGGPWQGVRACNIAIVTCCFRPGVGPNHGDSFYIVTTVATAESTL